jgi:molybdopterin converting factor small subunit
MLVKVRLYATLQKAKPSIGAGEVFEVDVADRSTVADLIAKLNIGANEVKAIRINGTARADVYRLRENDEVDLFPPIGGG